ncbi:MAG TPA: carboxypeptidase-like regulatory domain-containing protein, partial [Acidobacteriaceae bacterium]|nr:carboxypeptidase-like regulatory domain-containing protein [Acidobacteriaceae bacterium]
MTQEIRRAPFCWQALLWLAVAVGLILPHASAQLAGTGTIQGTVSDQSGAVIPNAQVTLTDQSTGVKHQTDTSGGGVFSFPNLVVGTYNLSVNASGFKMYTRSGIVLEVGSNIGINVSMTVGSASQEVRVQANGLALQTQDTSFKQTIDQREMNELPLNGRQMTDLIQLAGGATYAPGNDMTGSKNFFSSKSISIAGGQGNQTDYRLDGADNNDYMTNVNLPFPFPDAVNQFSVESTAMGAQSGLHPGGEVNVVTNSGTNQFHGDAFEFIRNNLVNATNFFSTKKDQLHQNQFGGTLGGPIRRDKLFFFAGYQRTIVHQVVSASTAFVPSNANLSGDFSATDSTPLYNPITGAVLVGNHIDPSTFSPVSLALEKFLPKTTDPAGKVFYAPPG